MARLTDDDPLPYERRVRDLEDIYADAQRELVERIEAAIRDDDDWTVARVRAQLASVVEVLDELEARVTRKARALIRQAHDDGANRAHEQIKALSIEAPEIPGTFAGVQRDAVAQLQASLLDRLDSSRQTLGRQVEDIFAREQRRAALRATLGVSGSPRTAALDLRVRLLQDRAIATSVRESGVGFIDRAGRRWQLDSYAKMAVRTVTREAAVQGSIARMASHGINLARVSAHASACKVCLPWEGRLISLDGTMQEFGGETVYDTATLPPLHPNCRHSLMPVAVEIDALKAEMQAAGAL